MLLTYPGHIVSSSENLLICLMLVNLSFGRLTLILELARSRDYKSEQPLHRVLVYSYLDALNLRGWC